MSVVIFGLAEIVHVIICNCSLCLYQKKERRFLVQAAKACPPVRSQISSRLNLASRAQIWHYLQTLFCDFTIFLLYQHLLPR